MEKPEYENQVIAYMPFEQLKNINFRVASLNFEYAEDLKEYFGEGIISIQGDKSFAKNPFLALLFISPKGSDLGWLNTVLVNNGIGRFTTDEKKPKSEKPEYDFDIKSYIPFQGLSERLSFGVDSFYQEEETSALGEDTYSGTGLIRAFGDANISKKPYIIMYESQKDNEQSELGIIPVINGIGHIRTYDTFQKREPQYAFKILGYASLTEIINNK